MRAVSAPRGKDPARFWRTQWVVAPCVAAWLTFPAFFPARSPVLGRLLRGALAELRRDPARSRREYLFVMRSVVAAIHAEVPAARAAALGASQGVWMHPARPPA